MPCCWILSGLTKQMHLPPLREGDKAGIRDGWDGTWGRGRGWDGGGWSAGHELLDSWARPGQGGQLGSMTLSRRGGEMGERTQVPHWLLPLDISVTLGKLPNAPVKWGLLLAIHFVCARPRV